jgi:hypothetical protein
MNTVDTGPDQSVRLLFELSRDDNPRLFDDLMRFNKGPKRVNRLRFLAHEGLLAQAWSLGVVASTAAATAAKLPAPSMNLAVARQTNHAFDVGGGGRADE